MSSQVVDPVALPEAPVRAGGAGASAWSSAVQVARLLVRPTIADRSTWALPVTALGISSALSLTVAGGVRWFLVNASGDIGQLYVMCAWVALALLAAPLAVLAGASARLSANRRDVRLSSLSLLGASAGTIRWLTLLETGATAAVGAVVGLLGYLVLMPVVGLLPFMGRRIGATGVWLGVLPTLGLALALVALCLVSAAIGLRKVVVSPLGVRTRANSPVMGKWRSVLGIGGLVVVAVGAQMVTKAGLSIAVMMGVMLTMMALPVLLVNVLGPWLIALFARRDARRARGAEHLLAARMTLEDPKQLWRQLSGLAVTSFVATFMGVGLALSSTSESNPEEAMVLADIRTGVLLTLAIAFLVAACQIGVTQASAIAERRQLHTGLTMLGMPLDVLDRARRRAVLRPTALVVVVSALPGLLLLAPMASGQMTSPVALLVTPAVLVLGVLTVAASLLLTRRTLVRSVADVSGGRSAGVGE